MGKAGAGELVQGTLPLLILRTLASGPNHGFAIARRIQQVSNEVLRVEEGSLYPALHRMEQSGWVAAKWEVTESGRRARVYRLTRRGEQQLQEQEHKWALLTKAVGRLLRFTEG